MGKLVLILSFLMMACTNRVTSSSHEFTLLKEHQSPVQVKIIPQKLPCLVAMPTSMFAEVEKIKIEKEERESAAYAIAKREPRQTEVMILDEEEPSREADIAFTETEEGPSKIENIDDASNQPLAPAVMNAIKRMKGEQIVKKLSPKISYSKSDLFNVSEKKVGASSLEADLISSAMAAPQTESKEESDEYQITAYSPEKSENKPLQNFTFFPAATVGYSLDDDAKGRVTLSAKSIGGNYLVGTLFKENFYPTTAYIRLNEKEMALPLFSQEKVEELAQKYLVEDVESFLLIATSDDVRAVELSGGAKKIVELDEKFEEVTDQEATYYLLINPAQGLNELAVSWKNRSESRLPIMVRGETLNYFEVGEKRLNHSEFEIKVRHLFADSASSSQFGEQDLEMVGGTSRLTKVGLDQFEFENVTADSSKNYLRVKNSGTEYKIAWSDQKVIEIPGLEFMQSVLSAVNLPNLDRACLVDMNLSGEEESIEVAAMNERGQVDVEVTYLDRDGVISKELSPLSKKAIVVAESGSELNFIISKSDGSTRYLQTICQKDSYTLEQ